MGADAVLAGAAAPARRLGWARAGTVALVAGLAGMTLFLAWRSLGWPLIHDAPLMHYVAWRIAETAASRVITPARCVRNSL